MRPDADFLVEYVHGQHGVRDYFDRFLAGQFDFLEDPGLRARCAEHLWSAFAELEAVPRSDPFWAGSNLRTTFTKLREFYDARVPIDGSDIEHCWRSFAIVLCYGGLDRFKAASE